MPKYPKEKEKITYISEFVYLTWEAVRRNPDYQKDYRRFLENYGLTPDDFKPKKNPDGSELIPFHPANQKPRMCFDPQDRRFVPEDETPAPDECNLSYMLDRWGFACDPDAPPYEGPSWARSSYILSKGWRKRIKKSVYMPDLHASEDLKKLPGVLEVERFPKVCLNHPDPEKAMKDAVDQGIKEGGLVNFDLLPWVVENPAHLTVTINLQAPSQLIRHALELLIAVCKAELRISDDKINNDMIRKCLAAWDLKQQGASDEQISQKIPLRKYELKEEQRYESPEMMKGDREADDDTYYKVGRIKDYLEKAEAMIQRGTVI